MAKPPKGVDAKLPVYGWLTYDSGVTEHMMPGSGARPAPAVAP